MNINANVGLRDRSRITLGGFKGLDTLSAAVDVSAIHATEMKNLISRDGVNHKRFGWQAQYRIRDSKEDGQGFYPKVQGIFEFTIYGINFLFVYANKKFWVLDKNKKTYENITNLRFDSFGKVEHVNSSVSPVDRKILDDVECKCYLNGNKAYFIGMGDYLVFSKWQNDCFELRRVVGNEDIYIPTTTENIGSEEFGQDFIRISAEERNILSPYFYNTLFGPKSLDNSTVATYYLDTKEFIDAEITVETMLEEGEEVEVVLTRPKNTTEDEKYYKTGDIFRRAFFSLNEINNSANYSKTIVETENCLRRWVCYEDFERAKEILGYSSSWFIRQRNLFEFTIEEYQQYLDERFKYYMKFSPDVSYTKYTRICRNYRYKVEPTTLNLINFDNAKLIIKNRTISYNDQVSYLKESDIRVYYETPRRIESTLVYKSKNIEVEIAKFETESVDVQDINVDLFNEKLTANISYKYNVKDYVDLAKYNAIINEIFYDLQFEKEKYMELSNGDYRACIYTNEGKLELFPVVNKESAYAPKVPDVPNIKVKLYKEIGSALITKSVKSCEFGAQGGTDRLFIVDDTGNTVRWSKDEDFTYFGEKSWCICGKSDKSITGMDRLNDSTMIVVKEFSPAEPSVFVISGNILTEKTEANTVEYTALFTPRGYQVGMGAVGEIVNFNGDCIMVAKDGLYAVSLGENMTVDSRYVLHRSRQISNNLEKFDLANAKCVSFNGKFFVAVGGQEQECYVADNKYTASFKGDIQNVVNYEWWRWTNIPVNVWGFVENELWFGTDDGQICKFSKEFYDETLILIGENQEIYEMSDDERIAGFNLTEGITAKKGDSFIPTCNFYGEVVSDKFEVEDGKTKLYLPLKDYLPKEKIYIDNVEYEITKEDLYLSIDYETNKEKITFYRNYKDKALTVSKVCGQTFFVEDKMGNQVVWAKVGSQPGMNPATNAFTANLINKNVVSAIWVSGAMDLGTRAYSKSLTYLVLTGEKDLANRLKYGLKTRFTHRDYELLRANNDLDFTELDLQTVSMDSDFASSYTKKLNIRNINFLMFYFVSDTAEDVALNSIQIEFKLYKRNIGVR